MPLGMFPRLLRLTVIDSFGRGDTQTGHLGPSFERSDFGVHAHVSHENDFIDHIVYVFIRFGIR